MPTSSKKIIDVADYVWSRLKLRLLPTGMGIWKRLRPVALHVVVWIVSMYRLTLHRVVFIGITGSCGKTTTTTMVNTVLSSQYKGYKAPGVSNYLEAAIRSVLCTQRGHQFCVQEFTIGGLGEAIPLERQFAMFQPQIGVVTTVGDDHISAHGSREAIAAEK